ncbi:exosome complex component RRP40 [Apiospora hydei]|uniref:Exosome complex component RRP40 n=1 Tax=Apiospora hydei TaxID=1337664 RepID=A0ABR1VIB6_9PEZI
MATQADKVYVLPGDEINPALIPSHPKHPLRLGPGLRHVPPSDLFPTTAGQLVTDRRKNLIWVESNGGRYIPAVGDLVIGTIHHGAADFFYVTLSDYTSNATLPQLAFEMASKKNRPQLHSGDLVYARTHGPRAGVRVAKHRKGRGPGPLSEGMLYSISLGMARRLLMRKSAEEGKVVVLDELGAAGLAFETAVGRNGKMWVNSKDIKTVLVVGRAVTETDEKSLTVEQQKKLVRRLVKEMA